LVVLKVFLKAASSAETMAVMMVDLLEDYWAVQLVVDLESMKAANWVDYLE